MIPKCSPSPSFDAQRYDPSKRPTAPPPTYAPLTVTHATRLTVPKVEDLLDSNQALFTKNDDSIDKSPIRGVGERSDNHVTFVLPIMASRRSKDPMAESLCCKQKEDLPQDHGSDDSSVDEAESHTTIRVVRRRKSFNFLGINIPSMNIDTPASTLTKYSCICADHIDHEATLHRWCEKEIKGESPAPIEICFRSEIRCHFAKDC